MKKNIKNPAAQELGRKGGLATLRKHGVKHFKRLSKLATAGK